MGSEFDSESVCSTNIKQKDRGERERESRHKVIYNGFFNKTGVVQLELSKRVGRAVRADPFNLINYRVWALNIKPEF